MKKKTHVELQRQRISLMLRAQASILRSEFLNEVLPAALETYDRAIAEGEAIDVEPVNIRAFIEAAVAEVSSAAV